MSLPISHGNLALTLLQNSASVSFSCNLKHASNLARRSLGHTKRLLIARSCREEGNRFHLSLLLTHTKWHYKREH